MEATIIIKKYTKKIFHWLFTRILLKKEINSFLKKHNFKKNEFKIIYVLTPPPRLKNIGDQAQVVAICKWLRKNYPNTPIIEFDKDECISKINFIKAITNPKDIVFIHSGGNLGDRGIWSETGRRNVIQALPNNKIISLPQTIFFSDTEKGKTEKEKSIKIYNKHKYLTVIGRDFESAELAAEMFPNAKTFAIPDFVLSLDKDDYIQTTKASKKILFCLRNDDESIFSDDEKRKLPEYLNLSVNDFEYFDTTIEQSIENSEREKYVQDTLKYFSDFEMIVTDRFHGVIFATLLNKPTIVLPTVDHKLTSAVEWFDSLPQIRLLKKEEMNIISTIYEELLSVKPVSNDWNNLYFDNLQKLI